MSRNSTSFCTAITTVCIVKPETRSEQEHAAGERQ